MANFNEKINQHKEFLLSDQKSDYFIERIGSPACFYVPTICEKTANLIDATLKPCNTNECAIRARSLATKTTGEENEEI